MSPAVIFFCRFPSSKETLHFTQAPAVGDDYRSSARKMCMALNGETPCVLVVDDDHEIRTLLTQFLERNGVRAHFASGGPQMFSALRDTRVDLVVLDVMMPGTDGISLLRQLRSGPRHADLPVVMLTARTDAMDRILGLEMGADDYVPKPFNPRELLARIKAVLKRTSAGKQLAAPDVTTYVFDSWRLDSQKMQLTDPEGSPVALTSAEYRLLLAFVQAPNRAITREYLLHVTQGREFEAYDRSVDVLLSRVRSKLRDNAKLPELLKTVRGVGYTFTPTVTTQ
ncbi:MAG TPA: response regulator [Burkholderiaceae bacterium]|nr:response regulator [Burkholderiaceae bacterium]